MSDHDADVAAVLAHEKYRQQWGRPPRNDNEARMYLASAEQQLAALATAGYAVVKLPLRILPG